MPASLPGMNPRAAPGETFLDYASETGEGEIDTRQDDDGRGPIADAGQECDNYRPLVALDAADYLDQEEAGDLGCDTCLHWRQGYCAIYRRNS